MRSEILAYNEWHDAMEGLVMPRRKTQLKEPSESFGNRLARLRQAAGYSQRDLARELGISQRMVVYYEKEAERIPHPSPAYLGQSTRGIRGSTSGAGKGQEKWSSAGYAPLETIQPDRKTTSRREETHRPGHGCFP